MGRFKIGARVLDLDGDAGEIVDKRKGERLVRLDRADCGLVWLPKGDLVPANDNAVAAATAWVPKVGDRVRGLREIDGVDIGNATIVFDDGTGTSNWLVRMDDSHDRGHKGGERVPEGFGWWVSADEVEPVVAPATTPVHEGLTLEAGKFYRTRDGRKVGPMVAENHWSDGYPYTADRCDDYFTSEGKAQWFHDDLVAEWVEPATAEEVAVAPATAALKLEAGATYRGESGALHFVEANDGNASWPFKTAGEPHLSSRFWQVDGSAYNADESMSYSGATKGDRLVSLVEPAAPPAKFKVGDRVRYSGTVYSRPCLGTVARLDGDKVYCNDWSEGGKTGFIYQESLALAPTIPVGTTVTFTATGRVSAINENGHVQITFPDLLPGQNSFALPAKYVALAN